MCHLSEFSNCMIISGYKMKERWITIRGSILRMEEMRRKVVRGDIESVNRKKSRNQCLVSSLSGDQQSFVMEDRGIPISASLQKSYPFRNQQCRFNEPKYIVERGRDCSTHGVLYEITCVKCNSEIIEPTSHGPGSCLTYNCIGMTCTSVHWRMIHHLKGQKAKYSSKPLYRHDEDIHDGYTIIQN